MSSAPPSRGTSAAPAPRSPAEAGTTPGSKGSGTAGDAKAPGAPEGRSKLPGVQARSPEEREAIKRDARDKFLQGREALNRGEYASALVLLRTSEALYPSPGTRLNLALCEERLGMVASAWLHFQEVLKVLPPGDARAPIAKNGIAMVEARVPRLRIELSTGAPEGTRVTRDGASIEASELRTDAPIDPGLHTVVVSAPGRPDRLYEVTLVEGRRTMLTVQPGEEPAPPPPVDAAGARSSSAGRPAAASIPVRLAPDTAPQRSGGGRTAGFAIGGVGIVALGVCGVTGALAIAKKSEVDDLCPDSVVCSAEGVSAERTGKALAAVSTAAFAIGLAGVGVGAFLVLTSGDGEPARSIALGPALLPRGAGITAGSRF